MSILAFCSSIFLVNSWSCAVWFAAGFGVGANVCPKPFEFARATKTSAAKTPPDSDFIEPRFWHWLLSLASRASKWRQLAFLPFLLKFFAMPERVQKPFDPAPWGPKQGDEGGPRSPDISRPDTKDLLKKMRKVDPNQSKRYRQRTGQ